MKCQIGNFSFCDMNLQGLFEVDGGFLCNPEHFRIFLPDILFQGTGHLNAIPVTVA